MREEDLDWAVYHHIPENGGVTTDDLVAATGFEYTLITASLERLEHYLLIQRSGEAIRLISFQESLVKCQCRHTPDLPFVIENGVIKAKRSEE